MMVTWPPGTLLAVVLAAGLPALVVPAVPAVPRPSWTLHGAGGSRRVVERTPLSREAAPNQLSEGHGTAEPAAGKPLESEVITRSGREVVHQDKRRTRSKRQNQASLPTPTNLRVTSSGLEFVDLEWQYDGDQRNIEYLVNVYYDGGGFAKDQVARGTSLKVVGLAPSTTYQFSVKAFMPLPHGQRANSADSSRVTATTQELVLPSPVNLRATSVHRDAIDLAWQYDGDQRNIEYLVNVYYDGGGFVKDQGVRGGTSLKVVGLAPSTTYQFSVKAFRSLPNGQRANSADSSRITATTEAIAPVRRPPRPPPPPAAAATTTTTTITTPAPPPSPPPGGCRDEGQCSCPPPHQFVCVPCDSINTCDNIGEEVVCSTKPASRSVKMAVYMVSCGRQPLVNVEGIVRTNKVVECGSGGSVPARTVAVVECWGSTTVIVQCKSDGTWRPYGEHQAHAASSRHLCQFDAINSPVCGRRPPYQNSMGVVTSRELPRWPWLAGVFRLGKYVCTATIITPNYLITAAHCLTRSQASSETVDVREVRVQRLNSEGLVVQEFVKSVAVFPGFRAGVRPANDVALISLDSPVIFSYHVYPACLHTKNLPQHTIAATFNRTTTHYDWDLFPQVYDPLCQTLHHPCGAAIKLDNYQFCAADYESQNFLGEGSSGGPYLLNVGNPAVERWAVGGLVSSSFSHPSCDTPETICTSIVSFWPWISKCVQDGDCS